MVDDQLQFYRPVLAGVVDSAEKAKLMTRDQLLLANELAAKLLDMKADLISEGVYRGVAKVIGELQGGGK